MTPCPHTRFMDSDVGPCGDCRRDRVGMARLRPGMTEDEIAADVAEMERRERMAKTHAERLQESADGTRQLAVREREWAERCRTNPFPRSTEAAENADRAAVIHEEHADALAAGAAALEEVERLRKENARLSMLRPFARHGDFCGRRYDDVACDCGFSVALGGAR